MQVGTTIAHQVSTRASYRWQVGAMWHESEGDGHGGSVRPSRCVLAQKPNLNNKFDPELTSRRARGLLRQPATSRPVRGKMMKR